MKKYLGKFIRFTRESKNMTLRQVAGAQLSPSMISKFEHGSSDLSINSFLAILNNMGVTLADVNQWVQLAGYPTRLIERKKIWQAYRREDIQYLNELFEKCEGAAIYWQRYYGYLAQLLAQKLMSEPLSEPAIQGIQDYLVLAGEWTEYEILLFVDCAFVFPMKTFEFLVGEVKQKVDQSHYLFMDTEDANYVRENILRFYIEKNRPIKALAYISELDELGLDRSNVDLRLKLYFFKGIALMKIGNIELGKKNIDEAIQIVSILQLDELHHLFNRDVDRYLAS